MPTAGERGAPNIIRSPAAYQLYVNLLNSASKARLLKLMADYEAGAVDQVTYMEQEAEIMASLSRLTQHVNRQSGPQSFNTGLGL